MVMSERSVCIVLVCTSAVCVCVCVCLLQDSFSVEIDADTVRRTLAQWRAISFPKGAENVLPEGADGERERVQLATQVCMHRVWGWVGG